MSDYSLDKAEASIHIFNIQSAYGTKIYLFGAQFDSLLNEANVNASVFSGRM